MEEVFSTWVSNSPIDNSTKIIICLVTDGKIWLSGPANSPRATRRLMHWFLGEHTIHVICFENLWPAQFSGLLQSHTLMERWRGDLIRWSRRKKKWNIFPVVWTPHLTGSWEDTPGSPVSAERGRKQGGVGRELMREKEAEWDRNTEIVE